MSNFSLNLRKMLNPNTHRSVMITVLKRIYDEKDLAKILGFKGGTAAYLFYDLDRFSVDLDFNLLDTKEENTVFEKLGGFLSEFGTVREKVIKHFTLFFLLSYVKGERELKIEISRRKAPAQYVVKSYLGTPMLVMTREDMFAHKLMAMCERRSPVNRDLYDVWFFFHKLWPLNEKIVEESSGISFPEYLKKAVDHVENYKNAYILDGIGEFLTEKQKLWVKEHLKEDLIFQLRLRLENEEKRRA